MSNRTWYLQVIYYIRIWWDFRKCVQSGAHVHGIYIPHEIYVSFPKETQTSITFLLLQHRKQCCCSIFPFKLTHLDSFYIDLSFQIFQPPTVTIQWHWDSCALKAVSAEYATGTDNCVVSMLSFRSPDDRRRCIIYQRRVRLVSLLINYGCHVKVGPGTLLHRYQTKKSVPDQLSALKKVSAGRMTLAANPWGSQVDTKKISFS